ncbi:MAG TPA: GrpB family protein [Kofleriaceae bacterium]|nr:GrpB family protein [Kofleriaceae bacterium]
MTALAMARLIRRLEDQVRPEDLGGEPVAALVRRWSRLRSPAMALAVGDYDPRWPAVFAAEAARIRGALADAEIALHHVGSTSIPTLPGKNIIDIALAAPARPAPDGVLAGLIALGYEPYGPSPIDPAWPWLWRIAADGAGATVVHVCASGDPWLAHLVAFRDFLTACPDARAQYADGKRALAAGGLSWIEYSVAKRVLALRLTARAVAWAEAVRA